MQRRRRDRPFSCKPSDVTERRWLLLLAFTTLLGAAFVIGPSNLAVGGSFMAWQPPVHTAVAPGDHLQIAYYTWLWEDGVRSGHLPWNDVYQFTATGNMTRQPFGWPLVLVSVPVSLVLGPVAAYNALVIAAFIAAALAAAALARALGTSRAAAAVAGFAFAFAPFRVMQATSHFNALLAWLLPLLLLCIEKALQGGRGQKRWAWGAVAVGLSVIGAGELHLAVFAAGMSAVYLLGRLPAARAEARRLLSPWLVLVGCGAVLVAAQERFILAPSVAHGGRSTDEAAFFAPRLGSLVTRFGTTASQEFERYAYLGAVIGLLALLGLLVHVRRRPALVAALVALVAGSVFLAVSPSVTGRPGLQRVYRLVPFLSYSRVPGRIMIVAALALAVLGAFAIDRVSDGRLRIALAALAAAAIVVDVPGGLFERNPVVRHALPAVTRHDRVLELPAFPSGHFSGAVYTFGIIDDPAPRVGGYSPFVTGGADAAQGATARLSDLPVDACVWRGAVNRFGLTRVAVHRSLYGEHPLLWQGDGEQVVAALRATPGFTQVAEKRDVVVFKVDAAGFTCAG